MRDWRDNVAFVLVEPKEAGNIGGAARAIKNMGFRDLRLVRPKAALTDEARWLACNALDVLESARVFEDLAAAVQDASVVVGTTRRVGKRRGMIVPVERAAERIVDIARNSTVAILFGREARGLLNEEVEQCGFLMTIPSSKLQPSLNLAQSALIVAYELSKEGYRRKPGRTEEGGSGGGVRLVDQKDLKAFYTRAGEVLRRLEYIPRGDRDLEAKIMRNLKHFIGRAGITDWELKMLHGIITQIGKKID